jgi:hypothetical protein
MERIDARIAVSAHGAGDGRSSWLAGHYEVIPNGVSCPSTAGAAGREHRIAFIGRHDRRKGLAVLLRAWPEMRRRPARGCG